jgi:hypothetical protein
VQNILHKGVTKASKLLFEENGLKIFPGKELPDNSCNRAALRWNML